MRFEVHTPAHRSFDESPNSLRLVKAAKRAFLRSGGTKFSIRSVAKEARISVGAVQHYYPTRDKLVAAMLEYVVNEYERAYEEVFTTLPFNGEARLYSALDYLVVDACNQESRQFFFALYSLSCHNRFVATLVDEVFFHHRNNIAALVGAARPAFSELQCFDTATQIVGLLEGLPILAGSDVHHGLDCATMARLIRAGVGQLLAGGSDAGKSEAV